jgi:hypothetical protein
MWRVWLCRRLRFFYFQFNANICQKQKHLLLGIHHLPLVMTNAHHFHLLCWCHLHLLINKWLISYSYHSQDYQLYSSRVLQTQWLPGIYFLVSSHLLDGVKALEKFLIIAHLGKGMLSASVWKENSLCERKILDPIHRRFLHIYINLGPSISDSS